MSKTNSSQTPTDKNLQTSDVTNNNVSTSKHGFAPKAPNDATQFLNGAGNYAVPAGGTGISIGLAIMISQTNYIL